MFVTLNFNKPQAKLPRDDVSRSNTILEWISGDETISLFGVFEDGGISSIVLSFVFCIFIYSTGSYYIRLQFVRKEWRRA